MSNPLQDRLEQLDPELRASELDKLRASNEDTDYAYLVRWCLDEAQESVVSAACTLSGQMGADTAALIVVGRLQAIEQLKAMIFGRNMEAADDSTE